jgi:hypothetical protein
MFADNEYLQEAIQNWQWNHHAAPPGKSYVDVNNYLRYNEWTDFMDATNEQIEALEEAFSAGWMSPESELVLYRGIGSMDSVDDWLGVYDWQDDPSQLIGTEVMDGGYVATNPDPSFARAFADPGVPIFEMHVGPGDLGLILPYEFLLDSGLKYRVIDYREEDNVIVMEVISP